MLVPRPHRRLLAVTIALYVVLGAAWAGVAHRLVRPVIVAAYEGRSFSLFNRVLQGRRHPVEHYFRLWDAFSGAVLLGGLLHLAIVLLVVRLDRRPDAAWSEESQHAAGRVRRLVILCALFFLGLTVLSGPRHDYVADLEIWDRIRAGDDPWWIVAERGTPLNAYGPLFNVLAGVAWVNPLAPKLLFAFVYLLFVVWLITRSAARGELARVSPWALAALLGNPFVWVEIAYFGHFDVLMGVACVAALHARRRDRDLLAGTSLALGVLIKYLPLVVLPFLVIDGRRLRLRLLFAAAVTVFAGLTVSCAVWGPSTFRAIAGAAQRGSALLSVFRYLRGAWSPLRLFTAAPDWDGLAVPCLVLAGGAVFVWCWRHRVEPAVSAVLALLTTLLFYPVGFPQYQMVLLLVVLYWRWAAPDSRPAARGALPRVALVAYFGWLALYNIFSAVTAGVIHADDPWAWVEDIVGLPTFLLGGFLLAVLMRELAASDELRRDRLPDSGAGHDPA